MLRRSRIGRLVFALVLSVCMVFTMVPSIAWATTDGQADEGEKTVAEKTASEKTVEKTEATPVDNEPINEPVVKGESVVVNNAEVKADSEPEPEQESEPYNGKVALSFMDESEVGEQIEDFSCHNLGGEDTISVALTRYNKPNEGEGQWETMEATWTVDDGITKSEENKIVTITNKGAVGKVKEIKAAWTSGEGQEEETCENVFYVVCPGNDLDKQIKEIRTINGCSEYIQKSGEYTRYDADCYDGGYVARNRNAEYQITEMEVKEDSKEFIEVDFDENDNSYSVKGLKYTESPANITCKLEGENDDEATITVPVTVASENCNVYIKWPSTDRNNILPGGGKTPFLAEASLNREDDRSLDFGEGSFNRKNYNFNWTLIDPDGKEVNLETSKIHINPYTRGDMKCEISADSDYNFFDPSEEYPCDDYTLHLTVTKKGEAEALGTASCDAFVEKYYCMAEYVTSEEEKTYDDWNEYLPVGESMTVKPQLLERYINDGTEVKNPLPSKDVTFTWTEFDNDENDDNESVEFKDNEDGTYTFTRVGKGNYDIQLDAEYEPEEDNVPGYNWGNTQHIAGYDNCEAWFEDENGDEVDWADIYSDGDFSAKFVTKGLKNFEGTYDTKIDFSDLKDNDTNEFYSGIKFENDILTISQDGVSNLLKNGIENARINIAITSKEEVAGEKVSLLYNEYAGMELKFEEAGYLDIFEKEGKGVKTSEFTYESDMDATFDYTGHSNVDAKIHVKNVEVENSNPEVKALLEPDHIEAHDRDFWCVACDKNGEGVITVTYTVSPYDESNKDFENSNGKLKEFKAQVQVEVVDEYYEVNYYAKDQNNQLIPVDGFDSCVVYPSLEKYSYDGNNDVKYEYWKDCSEVEAGELPEDLSFEISDSYIETFDVEDEEEGEETVECPAVSITPEEEVSEGYKWTIKSNEDLTAEHFNDRSEYSYEYVIEAKIDGETVCANAFDGAVSKECYRIEGETPLKSAKALDKLVPGDAMNIDFSGTKCMKYEIGEDEPTEVKNVRFNVDGYNEGIFSLNDDETKLIVNNDCGVMLPKEPDIEIRCRVMSEDEEGEYWDTEVRKSYAVKVLPIQNEKLTAVAEDLPYGTEFNLDNITVNCKGRKEISSRCWYPEFFPKGKVGQYSEIISYEEIGNQPVGTYDVKIVGTSDYSGYSTTTTMKIVPAEVNITAKDVSISSTDDVPAQFEYSVDGLCGPDKDTFKNKIAVSCKGGTPTKGQVGVYELEVGYENNKNYDVTTNNGELTIKGQATKNRITATDYNGVYDGKEHSITASADFGTIKYCADPDESKDMDEWTWTSEKPTFVNAAEDSHVVYAKAEYEGMDTVMTSATVYIWQKQATVNAKDMYITYGDNVPDKVEYETVGFVGSDDENLEVTFKIIDDEDEETEEECLNAGTYDIDISCNEETFGNYYINTCDAELHVSKKSPKLKVSAENMTLFKDGEGLFTVSAEEGIDYEVNLDSEIDDGDEPSSQIIKVTPGESGFTVKALKLGSETIRITTKDESGNYKNEETTIRVNVVGKIANGVTAETGGIDVEVSARNEETEKYLEKQLSYSDVKMTVSKLDSTPDNEIRLNIGMTDGTNNLKYDATKMVVRVKAPEEFVDNNPDIQVNLVERDQTGKITKSEKVKAWIEEEGNVKYICFYAPHFSEYDIVGTSAAKVGTEITKMSCNNVTYTGKKITPNVLVKANSVELGENDYTLKVYADRSCSRASEVNAEKLKSVGTYTLKAIAANEEYSGTGTCTFKILPAEFTVNPIDDKSYTGDSIKPKPTVMFGEETIDSENYDVMYGENTDAGTGIVVVTDETGNFGYSSKQIEFNILRKSISSYEATTDKSKYAYTGDPVEPEITVEGTTGELVQDTDFTVEYSDNTAVGTAKATIKGIGNYKGTISKTFTIEKTKNPPIPTGITAKPGQKLSEIALPEGWKWIVDKDQPKDQLVGEAGTRTFRAKYEGEDAFKYETTECKITVSVSNPYTVSVKSSVLPLKKKQSIDAGANLNISEGDKVTAVSSNNAKVLSVSGTKIKGKKKGEAIVTVTLQSKLTVTYIVKVQTSKVKAKISLGCPKKITMAPGQTVAINASKGPVTCKYKLKYTSSKKKVAAVSKKGVITAKKAGTAKITVKCGTKKKTIKVKVTN